MTSAHALFLPSLDPVAQALVPAPEGGGIAANVGDDYKEPPGPISGARQK